MSDELGFVHRFVPATRPGRMPLLLLHGTGGDETDLIPIGQAIAPGAALLAPRGRVLENGMRRFFRRVTEGVFDPAEVRQRADELAEFILTARQRHGLPAPMALGFSNGANVASVILLRRPGVLGGAILLRPMDVVNDDGAAPAGSPVLMLSGADDAVAPLAGAQDLADRLRRAGAAVDHRVLPAGHALTRRDMVESRAWLDRRDPAPAA